MTHVNLLTADKNTVKSELDGANTTLHENGIRDGIRFIANPFGGIPLFGSDNAALIRDRYIASRRTSATLCGPVPYDISRHPRHPLLGCSMATRTLAEMQTLVKKAARTKSLLIWYTHYVGETDITEEDFDSILSYIKNTATLPTKTLSDVFNIGTPAKMSYTKQNVSDFYSNCLASSATQICNAVSLSEETPSTFALAAQPDIPRALTATLLHSNITEYTIVISGLNSKGESVTETFTESSGWTWTTSHAYSKITSIIMTARTGTGVDDTISIGTTDKIGLSNPIYLVTDIYKIKKNSTDLAVDTTKIDTVYSTYDLSSSAISDTDALTVWYLSKYSKVI